MIGRRAALFLACSLTLFPAGAARADEVARDESDKGNEPPTYTESVTVTATLSPTEVKDAPGTVSVIERAEIEETAMSDAADLLRYEPGVYVSNDVTRLGMGGFNIRGIGGNRVSTRIDGIKTAEEFAFGPLSIPRETIDVDSLESVEIVRSAGSALYGSDAIGGVVSFETRDPRSFLADTDANVFLGLKAGFDGRDQQGDASLAFARGGDRWQGSLQVIHRDGHELDNQGDVDTPDASRTEPNPMDRSSDEVLGKLVFELSPRSSLKLSAEWLGSDAQTEVLSGRGPGLSGNVLDLDADDEYDRGRLSLEQSFSAGGNALFDHLAWRVYGQDSKTRQDTVTLLDHGAAGVGEQLGSFRFEQTTFGADVRLQKSLGGHLLSYGAELAQDDFDVVRDRSETYVASGDPVPTSLPFPTSYFPDSQERNLGVYVQDEISVLASRLRLIPGLRWDAHDLDADQNDPLFPASTVPVADFSATHVSPRFGIVWSISPAVSVFGQYAEGFRTPPYSSVNTGFTNFAQGYQTLPNPDLEPETSDNVEAGIKGRFSRGDFAVTLFDNHYGDFIDLATVGFDPQSGLLVFQSQNIQDVRIRGVEVRGTAVLTPSWSLLASFASTDGEDRTASQPLDSIEPPRAAAGVRFLSPAGKWSGHLTGTWAAAKGQDDLPDGSDQFRAPSYVVLDAFGTVRFSGHASFLIGVYNLTDETYWTWANARGQVQGSSTLDRYTSPGRTFAAQLRVQL